MNKAPRLILVKHSLPEVAPGVTASRWRLSEEGRRRCEALAGKLAVYDPGGIVSSVEPKAVETAQVVAERLGRPFEAAVAEFFERPGERVFGNETADEAHGRFAGVVRGVLAKYPDGPVVAVTHGTVMALFVARANGLDAFPLWKRLGLPSLIALSGPEMQVVDIVEEAY